MSKKNKRYIVYEVMPNRWYWYSYMFHRFETGIRKTYELNFTRKELVSFLAGRLIDDEKLFNYMSNDKESNLDYIERFPYRENGRKYYNTVYHICYIVTVTSNGVEYQVNMKALEREVIRRKNEMVSKSRNHMHRWHYHKCWKDQYKCKKQYMIHKGHKDTVTNARKSYDMSWEEES